MITRPCRSTKCDAETRKPSVPVSQGVHQIRTAAPVQSTHWASPPERTTDDDQPGRREVVRDDPQDRRDLRDRRPLHVHRAVQEHNREVGEPEREPVALVRVRDRERADQEAAHPADQRDPVPQAIRRDRVRQPRVPVVHPPDQEEHDDDLHEPRPASPPATSTLVSWVIVKTKTRSKKSSSVETRVLRSMSSDMRNHLRVDRRSAASVGQTAAPCSHAAAKRTPSGIVARPELRASGVPPCARTQRREKVTLTVADVSCSPGTIGVDESAACAASR